MSAKETTREGKKPSALLNYLVAGALVMNYSKRYLARSLDCFEKRMTHKELCDFCQRRLGARYKKYGYSKVHVIVHGVGKRPDGKWFIHMIPWYEPSKPLFMRNIPKTNNVSGSRDGENRNPTGRIGAQDV